MALIQDLSGGMNLRDPAVAIAAGETGETLGCDFGVPGEVRPMREGLLTWTLPTDIIDAAIIYLGNTRYLFTTHASGLWMTRNVGGSPSSILIDAAFTGTFKCRPVNDAYVVFANLTLNKKWVPGTTATVSWGLPTPPLPTLAAATPLTKTIDDFQSLGSWTFTGGGTGGALAADAVNYKSGTQSMKLTCDAGATIYAEKAVVLDLSYFAVAGDSGLTPFNMISFFAYDLATVASLKIKLSCAADGKFDKDYYQYLVQLSGEQYVNLSPTQTGTMSPIYQDQNPSLPPGASLKDSVYNPLQDITVQTWAYTDISGAIFTQQIIIQGKAANVQQIIIQGQARGTVASTLSWTDLNIAATDFNRIGITAGRDWSTITAISIEVAASALQANISFADWLLSGGGNLWGDYYLAVAYQNDQGNYGAFTDYVGPITLQSQALEISGLTPSTDTQVTKRRYAIMSSANSNPVVTYLDDNTSSTDTFNTDLSTLTEVEANFNNHAPPIGILDIIEWQQRFFVVTGDANLYYSNPQFYEAFPALNQQVSQGGETLRQLAVIDQNFVAARGAKEHLWQLTGDSPAYWQNVKGAKVGAASSRLSIEDLSGGMVFMSPLGLYISGGGARGEYLPKVNPVIINPETAFGAQGTVATEGSEKKAGDRAYIYFADNLGNDRVLRLDWKLGKTVAHYVANFKPATIFADPITRQVYYALETEIYEFDAGVNPLPTLLTIPEQLFETNKRKDFVMIDYELSGGPLSFGLVLDGASLVGAYGLPDAGHEADPVSLPQGTTGRRLGLSLYSTTEDWLLTLPLEIMAVPIE